MANIITMLEKEIEKENVYVDEKGNTISIEKIEGIARKSYVSDLKAGVISFDVTYYDYLNSIMENFTPVKTFLYFIKDTLKYGREVPDMEKPVSDVLPQTPVAN